MPEVFDLKALSDREILRLNVQTIEELRRRGVLRSASNPAGDYAEYLFCKTFGWVQETNSQHGYDAFDAAGQRFQIKSRRLHALNTSRQMSAIRNIEGRPFDVLAGVLFDAQYGVFRAALVPFEVVRENTRRSDHTNSSLFYLRDNIWECSGVEDVTETLRAAQ